MSTCGPTLTKSLTTISGHCVLVLVLATGLGACGAARWQDAPSPDPRSAPTQLPSAGVQVSPRPGQRITVSSLLNQYYAEWRGTPYRFGGTSRSGIDCSAFTQQAMSNALGITLPRTTRQQLGSGTAVSSKLVRPGDLVFFKTGESLNHVGVMIGPGKFMHASTRNGVTVSRTDDTYWAARVIGYRRVIE